MIKHTHVSEAPRALLPHICVGAEQELDHGGHRTRLHHDTGVVVDEELRIKRIIRK
jgi:hypothetical protein